MFENLLNLISKKHKFYKGLLRLTSKDTCYLVFTLYYSMKELGAGGGGGERVKIRVGVGLGIG